MTKNNGVNKQRRQAAISGEWADMNGRQQPATGQAAMASAISENGRKQKQRRLQYPASDENGKKRGGGRAARLPLAWAAASGNSGERNIRTRCVPKYRTK